MMTLSAANGAIQHTCACGKSSTRPLAQLHKAGRCKSCKNEIPAPGVPISVDTKTFEKILKFSKIPVFVDFWANWCGPCKTVAPDVARVAASIAGEVLVLKVDTEANHVLAARYNIRSIPNFMLFKGGDAVDQRAGVMEAEQMEGWIRRHLS